MASSREYMEFILDQLSEAEDVSFRPMMGEFIIYHCGKPVGGIYDDRFLVKPVQAARAMLPDAQEELPYEGGKLMLPVDNVDDRAFLACLLDAIAAELPAPKKRR